MSEEEKNNFDELKKFKQIEKANNMFELTKKIVKKNEEKDNDDNEER